MKARNKQYVARLAMVGVALAWAGSALADGYRNPPPTAEGIGKSGVNSVFVDDASAISFNPANLAMQTNASYVASLTLARTENQYSPAPSMTVESDGDWNALPNIYYSQPIGDSGIVAGLGITTPFGQGISWTRSDFIPAATPTNTVPYEAQLALINLNPTIAFQVAEGVSLGVGLDVYMSKLSLTAVNGLVVPGPGQIYFDSELEAYGAGLGGNFGVAWDVNETHHVAATYRSAFEIDYSGDFKVESFPDADADTTMKFPNMFTLGYGMQLTEDIQLETMVEWILWSNNDQQVLEIEGQPPATFKNDWEDTFTIGLGGCWQLDEKWVVQAGYAFIQSPVPDSTIAPILPDADRHALSLGFGYTTGAHTLDVAYTFSIYADRNASPAENPGFPGDYDIDSNLIGLTYSYSF